MRRIPWLLVGWSLLPAVAWADTPVERRLYSDRVESSSFLWNDWNRFQENYHPLYAVDDDPATAWVEGVAGSGAGEWVRFHLTPLQGATELRLRVRNGYQKSSALYKANARAKQVRVTLLPSGQTTTATLTDVEGWQEIRLTQPAGAVEAVELRVESAYEGGKYTDLCLSDVEIYATATTRDNPTVERARLARVQAWKKDRLDAAALFKSTSAAQIPVAPAYALAVASPAGAPLEDDSCEGESLCTARLAVSALRARPAASTVSSASFDLALVSLQSGFSDWTPVQAVPTDTRRVPVVDGLRSANLWSCYEGPPVWGDASTGEVDGSFELPVPDRVGYLKAATVGTFAVTTPPTIAEALAAKPSACARDEAQILAWARSTTATAGVPSHLQALFVVACGTVEAREGMERVAVPQLLVYDDAGLLSLLVGRSYATAFTWRAEGSNMVISRAERVGFYSPPLTLTEARTVARP